MSSGTSSSQLSHQEVPFGQEKFPLVLIATEVNSPANIGSLFRLADAFGVEHIYLHGSSSDLKSNRLRRTARSTIQVVNHSLIEEPRLCCLSLKKAGFQLAALEISDRSRIISNENFSEVRKLALLLGNERKGLGSDLLDLCDLHLHIRMFGKNSSLNVAQAAGIALFEITKTLPAI